MNIQKAKENLEYLIQNLKETDSQIRDKLIEEGIHLDGESVIVFQLKNILTLLND